MTGISVGGLWAGESGGLVGRDDTLARLRDLLDSGSRTAVVTGIPGAGKTSVLSVVARAGGADGRLVLPVTCHDSDRDVAFGVLVDLLMRAPRAEALLELVVPSTTRPAPVDALRLRLEMLAWLERLGEEQPVVVVLDDAQWCDDSSLSVLGFVSRRLAGSQVSIVAAARGDAAPAALSGSPVVALPALSERDAAILLRRSGIDLDVLTLPRVLDRAGGNPLALLELGRVAAEGEPHETVPSSVEKAFGAQVAALPAATRTVLLLAAACEAELPVLGRVVPPEQLLVDLAPAETAGLVTVVDRVVRFRHPLVRSAVYSTASAADRLAAHELLAVAYEGDLERYAWHRAEATVVPEEEVAAALAAAADLATRRGASSEAARLMVRSSELSEGSVEREGRLLQAVHIHLGAGHFDWAAEVGIQLRAETDDPVVEATAANLAAYALAQTERFGAARRMLVEVLDQLRDADPDLGWASLTTLAVLFYRVGGDSSEVARWLEVYEQATEQLPPDQVPPLIPAARAWVRMQVEPTSRPPDLLELVRSAPVLDGPPELTTSNEVLLGAAAWLLDEPAVAIERFERSLAMMRQTDRPGEMTQTLATLALVQFAVGDYDTVEQSCRLVIDIAEARNQPTAITNAYDLLARVAAVRGDVDRARDLCERVLLEIPVGEALALEVGIRVTMSWVRLAERDVQGAWHEIRWIFDEDGQPRHPHISYRELGHYAAIAARADATDELARVVAVAEKRLGDGASYRLHLARARALLAGEDAEPWHLAAVREPSAGQWPFDLANAQLEYGAWLRRRYRQAEARLHLQAAVDTFARLGTRAWEEFARAELRAAGVATEVVEPSAWADLTGQERQIVRMAADGMTNPEIAAALYLSPRTVSTHLYNAFPKLGVTSRAQLRDVVPEVT
ncbi:AAA family ATPase [Nocardioides sp. SR21]|uniref:AAA family ATPase n=1 Tax=Nocardioides sp. SR21 TaxID=2919501 RepID=UPI001FAA8F97|nr:LuxR family transcriptional regulator [Nocardioides sp. SR21]